MRFTQISFIGLLSSLQGCTKETPVLQLESKSATSLDASSSSTTISSAPNSLRSSHQSKSAPNTSNSANIEDFVNRSPQIVTSTNKSSIDGVSDHISVHQNDNFDTKVHTRSNPEVGDTGITDETIHVPTSQVNSGSSVGTPITHNSDQHSSVIGVDNLDIPPINRDVLRTSENGSNEEIIGGPNMSNSRSADHVVAGSNQEEQPAGSQTALEHPREQSVDENQNSLTNLEVLREVTENDVDSSSTIQSHHSSVDRTHQDDHISVPPLTDEVPSGLRNSGSLSQSSVDSNPGISEELLNQNNDENTNRDGNISDPPTDLRQPTTEIHPQQRPSQVGDDLHDTDSERISGQPSSSNSGASEEDHENSGNDIDNRSNGTPTVNIAQQPLVIGFHNLDLQSIIDAVNATPRTSENGNNGLPIGGQTDDEDNMRNHRFSDHVDEESDQDGQDDGRHLEGVETDEIDINSVTTNNQQSSVLERNSNSSEHDITVDEPAPTVEELNQQRANIIQRLGGSGYLINSESTREECENELALIRGAIDEAERFNRGIHQLVTADSSINPAINAIAGNPLIRGESRIHALELRLRQLE